MIAEERKKLCKKVLCTFFVQGYLYFFLDQTEKKRKRKEKTKTTDVLTDMLPGLENDLVTQEQSLIEVQVTFTAGWAGIH